MSFSKCLSKLFLFYMLILQHLQAQITSPSLIQDESIEVPGITTDSQIYVMNFQQKIVTRKYYDGLGRLIQNVSMQASPTQKDNIKYSAFNNLGQQVFSYLPYDGSDGSGSYHSTAATDQASYYLNGLSDKVIDDSMPWSQKVIESSPLQRILSVGMEGKGFQPISGGHYKTVNYRSNNGTAYPNDALNTGVRIWNYAGTSSSIYPTGSLNVTELTDESGNLTIVYKDALGRNVLKRQIITAQVIDGNTEYCLDTYYVYDDANELRVIIPPKALTAIRNANPSPWSITVTAAVQLIFQFNYDNLGRLVEKKVPASNWIYIVYDPMNRPVLIQDGNLGSIYKWLYFKYDNKERTVSQGIYTDAVNGTSRINMQNYVNGLNYTSNYYEEKQTGGTAPNFYTNRVFPTSNQDGSAFQDLVYGYYDNYDFNNDGAADYSYQVQGLSGEDTVTILTRGIATGVYKKTLSNDAGTLSVWLHSVNFYDKRGNTIQTLSNNHTNTAASDTKTIVPDFIGKTLQIKIIKTVNSTATTVLSTYAYDYSNRIISIKQSNNGGTAVWLANYLYNELGQIVNKKLHSTDSINFFQNVDYRYNVNQKLTSINNSTLSVDNINYTNSDANDLFGEEILYEKTDAAIGNTAYYNGNISAIKWEAQSTVNNNQRSYIFSYDQLNRLNIASYKDRAYQSSGAWGNIGANDEKGIQYDLQGNIETLTRHFSNTTIDSLTYTYSGDQLANVTDASGNTSGFNGTISSSPYVYDVNGNLITDPKKATAGTAIAYNLLNRTDKINFTGTSSYIRYTYDASGMLLRKEAYNGSSTTTLDYIDGFVYQNLSLSYFASAEGRVRNNSGTLVFEYFIRDHLGNVRVSFDGTGSSAIVRQENSYYPFGMLMPQSYIPTQPNNNLFNGGSELQNDLGNLPDYYQTPNRNYDAVLGRFMAVDPLASNYCSLTPYQFSLNNLINNNDPTGAFDDMDNAVYELGSGAAGGVQMMDQAHSDYYSGQTDAIGGDLNAYGKLVYAVQSGSLTTEGVTQLFNLSWSGQNGNNQATDIYVTDGDGGFNVSATPTSDGNPFTEFYSYQQIANELNTAGLSNTSYQQSSETLQSSFVSGSNVTSFMALMTQYSKTAANYQAAHYAFSESDRLISKGAGEIAEVAGKSLGVISAGFTAYEGYQEHGLTLGLAGKVLINLVSTFTPYGWIYAAADLTVGMITGEGITDRIGDTLDGR